jgi:methyl-accepting chemotaxis protein
MQGISESSRKIVDIISVIEGIAFQTNILALNAAVEAALVRENKGVDLPLSPAKSVRLPNVAQQLRRK